MCRSSTYRERLVGYVGAFDKYKRDLHMNIAAHASVKADEIDRKMDILAIDVDEIKCLLRIQSHQEKRVSNFIDVLGGLDAVLEVGLICEFSHYIY